MFVFFITNVSVSLQITLQYVKLRSTNASPGIRRSSKITWKMFLYSKRKVKYHLQFVFFYLIKCVTNSLRTQALPGHCLAFVPSGYLHAMTPWPRVGGVLPVYVRFGRIKFIVCCLRLLIREYRRNRDFFPGAHESRFDRGPHHKTALSHTLIQWDGRKILSQFSFVLLLLLLLLWMQKHSCKSKGFAIFCSSGCIQTTNPTELWNPELAWYSPSITHRICLDGLEHDLGINDFRPTKPFLIVEVLAARAKFLDHLNVFRTTNVFGYSVVLSYLPNPSARAGYDTRSIF